ncbi:RICIN domain-containing protein [Actinoplanes aureus]|uniref:RICIN domain-containing protein n=1 Tax=Actinoplanes aureus TaxID=2792083 RepID=A0A931CG88_9ACTN|nr:RICIN domain-containing protein [Actinoplanes aureus]
MKRKSGKCLTNRNDSRANGAELLQYTCNDKTKQLWTRHTM